MHNKTVICFLLLVATTLTYYPKPIIAWDLHDTLLQQHNRWTTIFNSSWLRPAITHMSWPLVRQFMSLLWQHSTGETSLEDYLYYARLYENPYLEQLLIQAVNAHKPIPGMKEIISELKALRYEQHILSNIGYHSFHCLVEDKAYEEINQMLQPINMERSLIVTRNSSGPTLKKPNPLFYRRYLKKNQLDLTQQHVIFIDDNCKNIEAAQKLGFDTILYNNPQQVREALIKRNIPLRPTDATVD